MTIIIMDKLKEKSLAFPRRGQKLSRANMKATFIILIFCFLLSYVPNLCHSQQQQLTFSSLQPYFTKSMDSLNIKENTPVDEIIYTLEAQIEQSRQAPQLNALGIIYNLEGTNLFKVNKTSGQVRVAQQIDREQTGDSLTFQVIATPYFMNRPGTSAQLSITVYILDENDNPPKIERIRIAGRNQEYNATSLARGTHYWLGGNQTSGKFNQSPILSANSKLGAPLVRLNVSENSPQDYVIVDLIEAIDVDKVSTDPLSAMCLNCEPEFELRSKTANLLNDRLEWSIVLIKQLVHVPRNNIRQLHVLVSDGKFNTSVIFEVTIDDVQNKPPQFIGSTTCIVRENVPIDKTILHLQAVDGDAIGFNDNSAISQANNNIGGRQILYDFVDYNGQSSSHQGNFKLHPLTGQLQVANRLDREAHLDVDAVLNLQVRARELTVEAGTIVPGDDLYDSILTKLSSIVDQSNDATSVADITVILVDVNDNAPHWLNSSEIAALNFNQSPFWHNSLPSDRDTGRNYQVQVRENSPPASVLTTKNEIFVYDLDSGENAEFDIAIEDPFNLFDVEPKHVIGFASVTLKLASSQVRGGAKVVPKLLDYENINNRSYIIQLYAVETKTNELFKSKAQIQINVLDVNDNAPDFKESAFIANIREDAPAGKIVKLAQAIDKDELSKQITYSLHGKSSYLFDINPTSGLITVAKCEPDLPQTSPIRSTSSGRIHSHPHQQTGGTAAKTCLDYELQKSHHLMVEASDGELSSRVPLTVFVDDASDNAPVFTLPIVDVVIEEGAERLDPPIKIEAMDVDQTSVLSYSIVEGNFAGLFSIDNTTGELQLTGPIRIAHDDLSSSATSSTQDILTAQSNQPQHKQQQFNKMTLIVQASDGQHTTNGTVRIDILDANDNAPKFMRPFYEKEITESYSPGQSVLTVRAFDLDRGNNARVSYRIERGSHNQFEINQTSGEISVSLSSKPFDSSKKDNYTFEVVAYDHGLVSKSSSVNVNILVLNTNIRAPEFTPQIQRVTIPENTLNNTPIHRMTVLDYQQQKESNGSPLVITFEPGPIEALDKHGQSVVDNERLESMFSVSTNTGDVAVNSALDHDFAAYVNLTIFASYRSLASFNPNFQIERNSSFDPMLMDSYRISQVEEYVPKSTGFLIINVVDDNNNPPTFAAPWSTTQPELSFRMPEELPVGSILTQLVASDPDSKISHFKIEPPSEYFELDSPQSGTIITKKTIDYDALMRQTFLTPSSHRASGQQHSAQLVQQQSNNILQFNVFVYDSGVPQLSAKAIMSVEILPVNDHDCKFEQPVYEAHVKENSPPDIVVTQVRANDLDFGEQHSTVSYQLIGEHRNLFNIDSRTGLVSVSNNGSLSLDRERFGPTGMILLTVIGRDEQQQAHQSVVDNDESLVRSSSHLGHRHLNQRSSSHIPASGGRSCAATIRIYIDDINDNPPLFSQRIYEVIAYDTDAIDVPLVKLIVRDDDNVNDGNQLNSSSPRLINSFKIVSGNINDSFNVTPQGMIYTTRSLNEIPTKRQPIELRVQIKQQSSLFPGVPTLFTDECLVRINLLKINRYAPEWRLDSLKGVVIEENLKPGSIVTRLSCSDRDFKDDLKDSPGARVEDDISHGTRMDLQQVANPLRYWIKENGNNVHESREFRLDPINGNLVTRMKLDREKQEYYQLIVSCEDNGKPQSLESITPLYITVLDVDDNKPEFIIPKNQERQQLIDSNSMSIATERQMSGMKQSDGRATSKIPVINFSVEEHQSKGLQVGEIRAEDRDLKSQYPITFCLVEGNEFQEFSIDQVTGILYTNQTLDRERQSSYDLLVKAINDGSPCDHSTHKESGGMAKQTATSSSSVLKRDADVNQNYGLAIAHIEVLDINDNAPIFKRSILRAGVHHRSLMNTLITQVAAHDPDSGLNGTLSYKIVETLMYKTNPVVHQQVGTRGRYDITNERDHLGKPIQLIQSPFRIDQQGNIYTQQLLTQYQLMSMFSLQIEATEQSDPWRTAVTKLEIYLYEIYNQLKIRINIHPRLVETYKYEIETLMSNATKYTAIINRARSYYGVDPSNGKSMYPVGGQQSSKQQFKEPTLDLAPNQVDDASPAIDPNEPNYSNIHMIFVDNYRIVNPNLVMEKFDLTSAQLFTAQSLTQQFRSNGNEVRGEQSIGGDEVTSLIDKIALASAQAVEYHSSPSSLIGIDWLESPSVLFVTAAGILTIVGFVFCLMGCCCTSRIKDHIIKVAMDKLVKQQTLQAKINERVLAATRKSYANGNQSINNDGSLGNVTNGQLDYILQQGGLMSSFDATKGCMNNNYENMNVLQRAMASGEYIDPNYLTLNGHLNMGAHYFDTTELEKSTDQFNADMMASSSKHMNGSTISLSMADEVDDSGDNNLGGIMHDRPNGDWNSSNSTKEQKLYSNGVNGIVSSHSKRQQVPASTNNK